ncbi:MAG TPA: DUF5995 family protein [Acidimicrobiales bacterium]|nr:DUF5995 family protein [Acidimicrobiales bacterium]
MNAPPAATGSVQGVLDALDEVIATAVRRKDRAGYFAAMYRQVTAKVAEGIAEGFFDDAERMERLDVVFATRYLAALGEYQSGRPTTRSWELAFDATASARPLIVQHLLAGMNAHINLDLGIAAATTAPGRDLSTLRKDFDRINEVLALLIGGIEGDIADVSPWIWLLDKIGGRHDDEVVRFSIEVARTEAWRFAVELAPLAPGDWPGAISARDAGVARVGRRILDPGLLGAGLLVIRARESNDVPRVIRALTGVTVPSLPQVERRVRLARSEPPGPA